MLKLKKGMDRRFRAGHPWIYSNEIEGSFRELEKGQEIVVADAAGKFLARGYANPHSLITFRALSRDEKEADAVTEAGLERRLRAAWLLRKVTGKDRYSFRLCYGEADFLPGLVIDLWRVGSSAEAAAVVFSVQAHTAGADRWMKFLPGLLKALAGEFLGAGSEVGIVARNDVSVRKLEGIAVEEPRWLTSPVGEPGTMPIWVRGPGAEPLAMNCDWFAGQKTGFFLDQADNIALLVQRLSLANLPSKKVRVLDLCCYVGQWSAQLAAHFSSRGVDAEFVLVDASAEALAFAEGNVRRAGAAHVRVAKLDVLHELGTLESGSFDLVISDPPALVKSRKDLGAGTHAYLQLHTQAIRLTRSGGWVVACSCSGLLPEEDFAGTLAKAGNRNGGQVQWIARGGPAADHPILASFPEGRYLKCWVGVRG